MKIRKILIATLILLSYSSVMAQTSVDIIPRPVSIEMGSGEFRLTDKTPLVLDKSFDKAKGEYIVGLFTKNAGVTPPVSYSSTMAKGGINARIVADKSLPSKEGYTLKVDAGGILIESATDRGLLNGFKSLIQILTANSSVKGSVPFINITDYPRFEWRGTMLDVSRQFFDKDFVIKYIDWLALHKINIFHWHLTDDNGWRVDIREYPELTRKGAWRGANEVLPPAYGSSDKRYGGFYTHEDIREVVAYAAARGVDIMPEIEIPGHSRAVVGSYPAVGCENVEITKSVQGEIQNVWCVGREENFEMLDKIIGNYAELFPFEYIHIAGDEVNMTPWKNCPHCQQLMKEQGFTDVTQLQYYFVRRVEQIVNKHGRKAGGWNEILKGGNDFEPSTMIFAWQDVKYAVDAVRKGRPTVVMPGQYMYIDMAQSPTERGHRWAAIVTIERLYSFDPVPDSFKQELTPEQMKNFVGIQSALFSEYLDRPSRFVEYQSYPRLAAVAEMGWTAQADRNWNDFYTRLTRSHLKRLTKWGIAFRDFPPSAIYDKGAITVTPPYTGAVVRYDSLMNEPTFNSPIYTKPIVTGKYEEYRFKTFGLEHTFSPQAMAEKAPIDHWNSDLGKMRVSRDVTADINKDGVWYVNFAQDKDYDNKSATVTTISLLQNGNPIAQYEDNQPLINNPKYKFTVENVAAGDKFSLTITIADPNDEPTQGAITLECSPYQEPQVTVSSSMEENTRFPLSNLTDYRQQTYARTKGECKAGDWVLYEFAEPINSSRIEVLTGIPNQPEYTLTDGYVEYTFDGQTFHRAAELDYGTTFIEPTQPIKAVKIVVTGTNNRPLLAIQGLKILRKKIGEK